MQVIVEIVLRRDVADSRCTHAARCSSAKCVLAAAAFSLSFPWRGEGVRNTWRWPTPDKMSFALRNWLTISAVFILGYKFHCNRRRDDRMCDKRSSIAQHQGDGYCGAFVCCGLKPLVAAFRALPSGGVWFIFGASMFEQV